MMSRKIFLKIVENLREIDYFKLKRDIVGELRFSIIQKCTVTLGMLAFEIAGDTQGDFLCMGKSNAIDYMYRLCREIVSVFGNCPFAHQCMYKGTQGSMQCGA
jgi:hypothetical protein